MDAVRRNAWPGCRAAVPIAAHDGRVGDGVTFLSGADSRGPGNARYGKVTFEMLGCQYPLSYRRIVTRKDRDPASGFGEPVIRLRMTGD
jgi:hypothetical protein